MDKSKRIYLISLLAAMALLLILYYGKNEESKEFFEGTLVKIQSILKL